MSQIHEVFAYLRIAGAARAIDYYTEAFGAKEMFRLVEPSGRVGHAQLDFGGTTVMIADEYPELDMRGPLAMGGTTVSIHLHVDDADAVLAQAEKAGGTILRPPQDQFYGERSGTVRDPFGHEWNIGHSIEEVAPDEMQRRWDEMLKS